jgi:hypothetical protein
MTTQTTTGKGRRATAKVAKNSRGGASAAKRPKTEAKSKAKAPGRGSKPGERRGGRKPGTPNKRTEEFRAWLDGKAVDLREVLYDVAVGTAEREAVTLHEGIPVTYTVTPSVGESVQAAKELLSYAYPKRKAIEFKDGEGNDWLPALLDYRTLPFDPAKEQRKAPPGKGV